MNISNLNGINAKIYSDNKKINTTINSNNLNSSEKKISAENAENSEVISVNIANSNNNFAKVNISEKAESLNALGYASEKIRGDLQKDVGKNISSERLNALKNAVKSGEYYIETHALVSAVFGARIG